MARREGEGLVVGWWWGKGEGWEEEGAEEEERGWEGGKGVPV